MMIKSALMTTGRHTQQRHANADANPFGSSQGAGHVEPNKAVDPGLVYDAGFNDWSPSCRDPASRCRAPTSCDGGRKDNDLSDLNYPTIAIGDLAGKQTVTRTVTNVGYGLRDVRVVSGRALHGITATPSSPSFTIGPGGSADYTVTFTRTTAALGSYSTGFVKWTSNKHVVRVPVAIRPVAVAAPVEVSGTPSGISYSVSTGYNGTLNFAARGLVAPTTTDASVAQDPDQSFDPADSTGTYSKTFSVSAGV